MKENLVIGTLIVLAFGAGMFIKSLEKSETPCILPRNDAQMLGGYEGY